MFHLPEFEDNRVVLNPVHFVYIEVDGEETENGFSEDTVLELGAFRVDREDSLSELKITLKELLAGSNVNDGVVDLNLIKQRLIELMDLGSELKQYENLNMVVVASDVYNAHTNEDATEEDLEAFDRFNRYLCKNKLREVTNVMPLSWAVDHVRCEFSCELTDNLVYVFCEKVDDNFNVESVYEEFDTETVDGSSVETTDVVETDVETTDVEITDVVEKVTETTDAVETTDVVETDVETTDVEKVTETTDAVETTDKPVVKKKTTRRKTKIAIYDMDDDLEVGITDFTRGLSEMADY